MYFNQLDKFKIQKESYINRGNGSLSLMFRF